MQLSNQMNPVREQCRALPWDFIEKNLRVELRVILKPCETTRSNFRTLSRVIRDLRVSFGLARGLDVFLRRA